MPDTCQIHCSDSDCWERLEGEEEEEEEEEEESLFS